MSCNCQSTPCCCPNWTTTTTTYSCEDGSICDIVYSTDCVIYNGEEIVFEDCLTISPGDTYTTILQNIISNLAECTTTTTTAAPTNFTFKFNSGFTVSIGIDEIFQIGRIDNGAVNINVDWGDGNTTLYSGTGVQNMSHNYDVNGDYYISVELNDTVNYYFVHITNLLDGKTVSEFTNIDTNKFQDVEIINSYLTTVEIDSVLHQLATSPYLISGGTVSLFDNIPPAYPSTQGYDDIAILQAQSWSVFVD